LATVPRDVGIV